MSELEKSELEGALDALKTLAAQRTKYLLLALVILLVGWLTVVEPVHDDFLEATESDITDGSRIDHLEHKKWLFMDQARTRLILAKGEELLKIQRNSSATEMKPDERDRLILKLGESFYETQFGEEELELSFFSFANPGEREALKRIEEIINRSKSRSREALDALIADANIDLQFATIPIPKWLVATFWLLLALITVSAYVLGRMEAFSLMASVISQERSSADRIPVRFNGPIWLAPVAVTGLESDAGVSTEDIRKFLGWDPNWAKVKTHVVWAFVLFFGVMAVRVLWVGLAMVESDPKIAQIWQLGLGVLEFIGFLNSALFSSIIALLIFAVFQRVRHKEVGLVSPQRRKVLAAAAGAGAIIYPVWTNVLKIFAVKSAVRFIPSAIRTRRLSYQLSNKSLDSGFYRIMSKRYAEADEKDRKKHSVPWIGSTVHLVLKSKVVDVAEITEAKLLRVEDKAVIVQNLPRTNLSVSLESFALSMIKSPLDESEKRPPDKIEFALDLILEALNYHSPRSAKRRVAQQRQTQTQRLPSRKLARLFDFLVVYLYRKDDKMRIQKLRHLVTDALKQAPRDRELVRRKRRLDHLDGIRISATGSGKPYRGQFDRDTLLNPDSKIIWEMPLPNSKTGTDVESVEISFK